MSHSKDIREKAIKYVDQGGSIKEVCKLFEVSRSSFQRWREKKNSTGSVAPKSRIKSPYKVDNEALKAYIKAHPDAYLNEIAAHFKLTTPCISIALKRLKITRKKRLPFIKKEMS
ncbi:TPA: IS630 transposase-related protein [Legionella pneumophila]|nr:helix-turn-helix domain-containing protein [Legionella pneumophila]HEL8444426.1 helix-turn-helix domain-containing protein [Legionella pneumophila]HEL8628532.1 helix-turn-helix domain-containing protein [Legionella pneumophila]HEM7008113.1 helix-turn-helix domain-containing protein [Legionella pneumophila]HEN4817846.1 helix-turn-helix domain-containing protein [Legionella pneumophila]